MATRKGRAVQKWEPHEDAALTTVINALVEQHGWSTMADADWRLVSAQMPGRSTKQCRERYFNVLDPTIVRSPWRADELDVLFRAHADVGNSWQEIAKRISGRSESQVKNVFYSAVRRAQRETERLGREVPPAFIVQQTAEREAKAGQCTLPGAVPGTGSPPMTGMVPTPAQSPAAPPAAPPAHALPGSALGPSPVLAGAAGRGEEGDLSLPDARAPLGAGPTLLAQMHAAQAARMQAAVRAAGPPAAPTAGHAVLPVVVANGIVQQPVHVYRRKNLVAPSPLGAPSAPSETLLGVPLPLDLGGAAHTAAPALAPPTLLPDGDGDVELEQCNQRIDSWLRPHTASPAVGLTGAASLGLAAALGAPARSPAPMACGQQMFVAGAHSPSLMLASAGLHMTPLSPSAFLTSASPRSQTVRVG